MAWYSTEQGSATTLASEAIFLIKNKPFSQSPSHQNSQNILRILPVAPQALISQCIWSHTVWKSNCLSISFLTLNDQDLYFKLDFPPFGKLLLPTGAEEEK